jgi:two-component system LytT family response regulator
MIKNEKITVKERDTVRFIETANVTHITCSGSLCTIHSTCEKSISICKLLKHFEEELASSGFVRVNHNTLVNFNHIANIKLGKYRKLILADNTEVKISRRKMYKVYDFLKKMLILHVF